MSARSTTRSRRPRGSRGWYRNLTENEKQILRLKQYIKRNNFKKVRDLLNTDVDTKGVKIENTPIADWFVIRMPEIRNERGLTPKGDEKYGYVYDIILQLLISGDSLTPKVLQYLVDEPELFETALHTGSKFERDREGGNPLLFTIKNPDVLQIAIDNGINLNSYKDGSIYIHRLCAGLVQHVLKSHIVDLIMVFIKARAASPEKIKLELTHLSMIIFGLMKHDKQSELEEVMRLLKLDLHDAYHEDQVMDEDTLIRAQQLTSIFTYIFMNRNGLMGEIPETILFTTFFGYQLTHPERITDEKIEFWRNKMLTYFPHGDDMVGNEGPLFYLHKHISSQGLTAETIEYQLERAGPANQREIPCFFDHNDITPRCQVSIKRVILSGIVSKEAWDAWDIHGAAAIRKKEQEERNAWKMRTGLNEQMPAYTTILRDRKKNQEDNTIEYSWTMCAFCLLPMERTAGCNYMGHMKPSLTTPHREHPWCHPRFFVKDLWEKYVDVGRQAAVNQLDRDPSPELDHIETCIECGRPCCNHHHVDLEHPGRVILLDNDPRYRKCPGGGRRELIARILAVREVYRKGGFKTPLEERRAAAWAADAAATNPDMLAKADELLANENVNANQNYTRNFGNNLPKNKTYENDPAYQLYEAVKPLANSANAVSSGKQAAANQRIVREDHERVHELAHRDDVAAQAAPMPNRQNRQNGGTRRHRKQHRHKTRKHKTMK